MHHITGSANYCYYIPFLQLMVYVVHFLYLNQMLLCVFFPTTLVLTSCNLKAILKWKAAGNWLHFECVLNSERLKLYTTFFKAIKLSFNSITSLTQYVTKCLHVGNDDRKPMGCVSQWEKSTLRVSLTCPSLAGLSDWIIEMLKTNVTFDFGKVLSLRRDKISSSMWLSETWAFWAFI